MSGISGSSGSHFSKSSQKSEIEKAYTFQGDNSKPITPITRNRFQKVIIGLFKIGRAPFKKAASKIVSRIVIPSIYFNKTLRNEAKKIKDEFLEKSPLAKNVKLTTFDDAELDGIALFTSKAEQKKFESGEAEDQKWIILANGNAELYEFALDDSTRVGEDMQANVLTFNYRGVGESQGYPHKMDDLITDADTCVQYLLSKGVKEEDIIIRGHSLGGGIATKVASKYEYINLINTNSYGSISGVAKAHIRVPIITFIVAKIIQKTGWELNAAKSWEDVSAKKLIVFHADDGVMLKPATLFQVVKQKNKKENVMKNNTVTEIETTIKFGVEHIKISKKMGIYDESIVVIYDKPEEIEENVILIKANDIRQNVKFELKQMYNEANELIAKEQKFKGFHLQSKYDSELADIADIDLLHQHVKEEIDYIDKRVEKLSDTTSAEVHQAIEKIRDYLKDTLTKIDNVADFEDDKFKKRDGHNYLFSYDEEVHVKIVGFAKRVFSGQNGSFEDSSESQSESV